MTSRVYIPADSLNTDIQNLQKAIQERSQSWGNWMDSDCAQKIQSVARIVLSASKNNSLKDKEALAFLDVLNSKEFKDLAEGPKHFVAIRAFFSRIFNEYFGTTEAKSSWDFAKDLKEKTEKALCAAKPNIVKVKKFEDLAKEHKDGIEKAYKANRPAIQDDSGKLTGFAKLLEVVGSDVKVDHAITNRGEPLSYEELCLIKEYLPLDLKRKMEDAFLEVDTFELIEKAKKSDGIDKVIRNPKDLAFLSDEDASIGVFKTKKTMIHPEDFASHVYSSTVVVGSEEEAKKQAGRRCAVAILQAINKVKAACESEAAKEKEKISENNRYFSIPWSFLEFSEIEKLGSADVRGSLEGFKKNFEMLARRKPSEVSVEAEYQVFPDDFQTEINKIFQSDDWKLCMGEVKDSS